MGDVERRYMDVGTAIAEKHKKNVLELIEKFGATPEKALEGCIVSLAADIMVKAMKMAEIERPI